MMVFLILWIFLACSRAAGSGSSPSSEPDESDLVLFISPTADVDTLWLLAREKAWKSFLAFLEECNPMRLEPPPEGEYDSNLRMNFFTWPRDGTCLRTLLEEALARGEIDNVYMDKVVKLSTPQTYTPMSAARLRDARAGSSDSSRSTSHLRNMVAVRPASRPSPISPVSLSSPTNNQIGLGFFFLSFRHSTV